MRSIVFGKFLGISLELHSTFVWLIIIVALGLVVFSPQSFFGTIMLLFFLFASVFLHELTHSIVAVSKGYKVEKIILLPIGGIAVTTDIPEKPLDEFLVAIAGPLFNFFVVGIIFLLVNFFGFGFPQNWLELLLSNPSAFEESLLANPLLAIFYVNLMLGSFNLFFPALPLDGGRVLRSIASFFFGFEKATEIVSKISLVLGALLFLFGFLTGHILVAIVALFIFFGSQQENDMAKIKAVLSGTKIIEVMEKKPLLIDGEESLENVFEKMKQKKTTEFLVKTKQGIGIMTLNSFEKTKKSRWQFIKAEEIAEEIPKIPETADAARVFQQMIAKGYPLLPVFREKKLLGVVKVSALEKLYQLKKTEKSR